VWLTSRPAWHNPLENQSVEAPEVSAMSVSAKSTILAQFEQVAREQNRKLAPLSDELILIDSGLDSLCFAIVVARLEDALGFDPFAVNENARFPVTLGDFITFYEDAAT
jgi:hypothetical protein